MKWTEYLNTTWTWKSKCKKSSQWFTSVWISRPFIIIIPLLSMRPILRPIVVIVRQFVRLRPRSWSWWSSSSSSSFAFTSSSSALCVSVRVCVCGVCVGVCVCDVCVWCVSILVSLLFLAMIDTSVATPKQRLLIVDLWCVCVCVCVEREREREWLHVCCAKVMTECFRGGWRACVYVRVWEREKEGAIYTRSLLIHTSTHTHTHI